MIDFFNVLDNSLNSQVFYAKGATDWYIWDKPANCKFVSIFSIGSGGGGGGGGNGGSGTARRGGGGGGSSSYTMGFFAASQLPSNLFIQVPVGGVGGIGGATGGNGGAGALSYVSIRPNNIAINLLFASGTNVAGGGAGSAAAGTGGTAGSISTGGVLSDLGLVASYIGQAGVDGLTTAPPVNQTISTGITIGGAAGAGTNGATPQNGASITGAGFINTIQGGLGVSGSAAGDGSSGYTTFNPSISGPTRSPMFFLGGAGGGSSDLSTGGTGGSGSYGCGGGGGGAGFTSSGGNGGRGGSGLVIITCF